MYAKWTSSMRSPSATAIERLKNGIPRFAFSDPSIGSTTTSVPFPSMRPTSSDTIETPNGRSRSITTSSTAASIAVVSSPPSPRRSTGSRSTRVGIAASSPFTSSTAPRQTASQSINRMQEQAGGELRVEERALLRHDVTATGDLPHVLDARRAEQECALGLAAVDGGLGLGALRGVGDALGLQRVDDLRVEAGRLEQLVASVSAVEDWAGKVVTRPVDRPPRGAVHRACDAVRGEDRQPLLVGRDDDGEKPGLAERERRLVPVVAVGDEQLGVLQLLRERVAEARVQAPEGVASAAEVGLAEPVDVDRRVPEEEQRLELRARRLQQAEAALLRAGVRPLVREDDPGLVRLGVEGGDEPLAAALHPVGSDVVLRQPPVRRLPIANEDAVLLPGCEVTGGLLLRIGERQVDDVVRAATEVLATLLV